MLVTQLCLTLGMGCSLPGSSVHGILQVRILEWVAFSFSRGSSRPRNQSRVSCIAGGFFTHCATREALQYCIGLCQRLFPNFKPLIKPGCGRFYSGLKYLLLHHGRQLNFPAMLVADHAAYIVFQGGKLHVSCH